MEKEKQPMEMQRSTDFAAADEMKSGDVKSPDVLLYSDLYKNAMMGADSSAKMVGKAGDAEKGCQRRIPL